jgi:hypothetical protein
MVGNLQAAGKLLEIPVGSPVSGRGQAALGCAAFSISPCSTKLGEALDEGGDNVRWQVMVGPKHERHALLLGLLVYYRQYGSYAEGEPTRLVDF